MPTCSFCKKNYEIPRGLTVFTFDGRSIYYCSSKCRRNANLKRDPKKVNWVKRDKNKKKIREVKGKVSSTSKDVEEKVEKKEDRKEEKAEEKIGKKVDKKEERKEKEKEKIEVKKDEKVGKKEESEEEDDEDE